MARTMFQDLYPEAIGVIGGSGLSRMGIGDFVEVHPPHMLEGPFGQPSGPITMREIGGKLFGFLLEPMPGLFETSASGQQLDVARWDPFARVFHQGPW